MDPGTGRESSTSPQTLRLSTIPPKDVGPSRTVPTPKDYHLPTTTRGPPCLQTYNLTRQLCPIFLSRRKPPSRPTPLFLKFYPLEKFVYALLPSRATVVSTLRVSSQHRVPGRDGPVRGSDSVRVDIQSAGPVRTPTPVTRLSVSRPSLSTVDDGWALEEESRESGGGR